MKDYFSKEELMVIHDALASAYHFCDTEPVKSLLGSSKEKIANMYQEKYNV